MVDELLPGLIDFRRDLHAHPELSFKEFRTTDKLVERLEAAGLKPRRLEETGLTVDVGEGPPIATAFAGISTHCRSLRKPACRSRRRTMVSPTLAATTSTPLPCSASPHAATDAQEQSAGGGTVRIIFQPAEETMPGGALSCIEQGVLEGVPRILALHCDPPRINVGQIGTRIGAITSASDTIKIELSGRGGHTSRPHLTEDLVFALAQIAVNVPAVLSRRVDVRSGVSVVWGGQISAGSAPNASRAPATWPEPCVAWIAMPGIARGGSCWTTSSGRSPRPTAWTSILNTPAACRR